MVPSLSGHKVTEVAGGGYHTLAVTEDGTLYSWGLNNHGQLGLKDKAVAKVPTAVPVTLATQDNKQVWAHLPQCVAPAKTDCLLARDLYSKRCVCSPYG